MHSECVKWLLCTEVCMVTACKLQEAGRLHAETAGQALLVPHQRSQAQARGAKQRAARRPGDRCCWRLLH